MYMYFPIGDIHPMLILKDTEPAEQLPEFTMKRPIEGEAPLALSHGFSGLWGRSFAYLFVFSKGGS